MCLLNVWKTALRANAMNLQLSLLNNIGVGDFVGGREALRKAEDEILVNIFDAYPSCPIVSALICSTLLLSFRTHISAY